MAENLNVLKQEADDDSFITDKAEATVVGDGDVGAHLAPPDEDQGVEQQDDAPPTQAPAYETPRVQTLRRGRTRLVKWRQAAAEAAGSGEKKIDCFAI